ncbi:hypothetical protein BJY52DRAFT_1114105 [Lactarius psammicola]|nr:hypothetical protein BJY52DRAFT_1114105 [Lactarius psammicola]
MSSLDSPSSLVPPPGVTPAPPPWSLRAKLYVFIASLKPVNREDPVLRGLPPGSYSPSETLHPSALALVNGSPQWNGGSAVVVLTRYEDSPVGPYDELSMSLKGFTNPYQKGTSLRVTNTYVSSRQSVWNGRKNWNLPKRLARFKFVPSGPMTSKFEVFLPDAERPFFTASLTDSRLPAIPISPRIVTPFMGLVQPPLLSGLPEDVQIATDDEWLSIDPLYNGRWQLAYLRPSEGGHASYGDGLHFPEIKSFWIGARFTGTILVPEGAQLRTKVK